LSLAYISNLFGVDKQRFDKFLDKSAIEYRDIPFSSFIDPKKKNQRKPPEGMDTGINNLFTNYIDSNTYNKIKEELSQDEEDNNYMNEDGWLNEKNYGSGEEMQFYIGNIHKANLFPQDEPNVEAIQKALDDNIMFKVVDVLKKEPLRYLAADAAVTGNFNAFIGLTNESAAGVKLKRKNMNILMGAIKEVNRMNPVDKV
jgi:hypothetical protein